MSGFVHLALALAAGLGLGLFYFGGLWLTVRWLGASGWPVLLMVGSFVGRTAVAVLGFYFIMDGSWQRMLACLAGFIIVRQLVVSRLRPERLPATGGGEGAAP